MFEHETHRQAAAEAIRALRHQVQWKPEKDEQHLAKRKAMGHLPDEATVEDYDALISAVLDEANSLVYHYPFGGKDYYAVSGEAQGAMWLIIFGGDGIMETAFPPDDLTDYLTKRGFVPLGRMEEVIYE